MVARHRIFDNMDINGRINGDASFACSTFLGQLDDDEALSDGGDDYISPEHQGTTSSPFITTLAHVCSITALLNDGLDRVRETIGDEDNTGFSDTAIKGFLWNCYFDVEKTVQWAIGLSRSPRLSSLTY